MTAPAGVVPSPAGSAERTTRVSLRAPGFVVIVSLSLLVLAWHIGSLFTGDLFLPSPFTVAVAFLELLQNGELLSATLSSGKILVLGFGLAIVLGVTLGIIMGTSRSAGTIGTVYVSIFWATPAIALLPLLIRWWGLGEVTKVVVVLLSAIWPIVVNTRVGIEQSDETFREMARSFGARRMEVLRHILIPAALPVIGGGLQVAVGRAVIGVIVAELFTSVSGLGALMIRYVQVFETPSYFAALMMFILFSMSATWLVSRLRAKGD